MSSGGGGDYPPHTVMGLPALSPTMSQGVPFLPCCLRVPCAMRSCHGRPHRVIMHIGLHHLRLLLANALTDKLHAIS